MNIFIFWEANGFTAKSFYSGSQSQMVPLDLLRVPLSGHEISNGNFVAVSVIVIGIHRPDIERFQKFQKFVQVFMLASAERVRERGIGGVVNRPPQPYLVRLIVIKAPHFVHLRG